MARAICGNARLTASATVASSALISCAISSEDLRSRSAAAWLACSVPNTLRVDGLRFKLEPFMLVAQEKRVRHPRVLCLVPGHGGATAPWNPAHAQNRAIHRSRV